METLKCIHNALTATIFLLFVIICVLVNKCCLIYNDGDSRRECPCEEVEITGEITPSNNIIVKKPGQSTVKLPLYKYLQNQAGDSNPSCEGCCAQAQLEVLHAPQHKPNFTNRRCLLQSSSKSEESSMTNESNAYIEHTVQVKVRLSDSESQEQIHEDIGPSTASPRRRQGDGENFRRAYTPDDDDDDDNNDDGDIHHTIKVIQKDSQSRDGSHSTKIFTNINIPLDDLHRRLITPATRSSVQTQDTRSYDDSSSSVESRSATRFSDYGRTRAEPRADRKRSRLGKTSNDSSRGSENEHVRPTSAPSKLLSNPDTENENLVSDRGTFLRWYGDDTEVLRRTSVGDKKRVCQDVSTCIRRCSCNTNQSAKPTPSQNEVKYNKILITNTRRSSPFNLSLTSATSQWEVKEETHTTAKDHSSRPQEVGKDLIKTEVISEWREKLAKPTNNDKRPSVKYDTKEKLLPGGRIINRSYDSTNQIGGFRREEVNPPISSVHNKNSTLKPSDYRRKISRDEGNKPKIEARIDDNKFLAKDRRSSSSSSRTTGATLTSEEKQQTPTESELKVKVISKWREKRNEYTNDDQTPSSSKGNKDMLTRMSDKQAVDQSSNTNPVVDGRTKKTNKLLHNKFKGRGRGSFGEDRITTDLLPGKCDVNYIGGMKQGNSFDRERYDGCPYERKSSLGRSYHIAFISASKDLDSSSRGSNDQGLISQLRYKHLRDCCTTQPEKLEKKDQQLDKNVTIQEKHHSLKADDQYLRKLCYQLPANNNIPEYCFYHPKVISKPIENNSNITDPTIIDRSSIFNVPPKSEATFFEKDETRKLYDKIRAGVSKESAQVSEEELINDRSPPRRLFERDYKKFETKPEEYYRRKSEESVLIYNKNTGKYEVTSKYKLPSSNDEESCKKYCDRMRIPTSCPVDQRYRYVQGEDIGRFLSDDDVVTPNHSGVISRKRGRRPISDDSIDKDLKTHYIPSKKVKHGGNNQTNYDDEYIETLYEQRSRNKCKPVIIPSSCSLRTQDRDRILDDKETEPIQRHCSMLAKKCVSTEEGKTHDDENISDPRKVGSHPYKNKTVRDSQNLVGNKSSQSLHVTDHSSKRIKNESSTGSYGSGYETSSSSDGTWRSGGQRDPDNDFGSPQVKFKTPRSRKTKRDDDTNIRLYEIQHSSPSISSQTISAETHSATISSEAPFPSEEIFEIPRKRDEEITRLYKKYGSPTDIARLEKLNKKTDSTNEEKIDEESDPSLKVSVKSKSVESINTHDSSQEKKQKCKESIHKSARRSLSVKSILSQNSDKENAPNMLQDYNGQNQDFHDSAPGRNKWVKSEISTDQLQENSVPLPQFGDKETGLKSVKPKAQVNLYPKSMETEPSQEDDSTTRPYYTPIGPILREILNSVQNFEDLFKTEKSLNKEKIKEISKTFSLDKPLSSKKELDKLESQQGTSAKLYDSSKSVLSESNNNSNIANSEDKDSKLLSGMTVTMPCSSIDKSDRAKYPNDNEYKGKNNIRPTTNEDTIIEDILSNGKRFVSEEFIPSEEIDTKDEFYNQPLNIHSILQNEDKTIEEIVENFKKSENSATKDSIPLDKKEINEKAEKSGIVTENKKEFKEAKKPSDTNSKRMSLSKKDAYIETSNIVKRLTANEILSERKKKQKYAKQPKDVTSNDSIPSDTNYKRKYDYIPSERKIEEKRANETEEIKKNKIDNKPAEVLPNKLICHEENYSKDETQNGPTGSKTDSSPNTSIKMGHHAYPYLSDMVQANDSTRFLSEETNLSVETVKRDESYNLPLDIHSILSNEEVSDRPSKKELSVNLDALLLKLMLSLEFNIPYVKDYIRNKTENPDTSKDKTIEEIVENSNKSENSISKESILLDKKEIISKAGKSGIINENKKELKGAKKPSDTKSKLLMPLGKKTAYIEKSNIVKRLTANEILSERKKKQKYAKKPKDVTSNDSILSDTNDKRKDDYISSERKIEEKRANETEETKKNKIDNKPAEVFPKKLISHEENYSKDEMQNGPTGSKTDSSPNTSIKMGHHSYPYLSGMVQANDSTKFLSEETIPSVETVKRDESYNLPPDIHSILSKEEGSVRKGKSGEKPSKKDVEKRACGKSGIGNDKINTSKKDNIFSDIKKEEKEAKGKRGKKPEDKLSEKTIPINIKASSLKPETVLAKGTILVHHGSDKDGAKDHEFGNPEKKVHLYPQREEKYPSHELRQDIKSRPYYTPIFSYILTPTDSENDSNILFYLNENPADSRKFETDNSLSVDNATSSDFNKESKIATPEKQDLARDDSLTRPNIESIISDSTSPSNCIETTFIGTLNNENVSSHTFTDSIKNHICRLGYKAPPPKLYIPTHETESKKPGTITDQKALFYPQGDKVEQSTSRSRECFKPYYAPYISADEERTVRGDPYDNKTIIYSDDDESYPYRKDIRPYYTPYIPAHENLDIERRKADAPCDKNDKLYSQENDSKRSTSCSLREQCYIPADEDLNNIKRRKESPRDIFAKFYSEDEESQSSINYVESLDQEKKETRVPCDKNDKFYPQEDDFEPSISHSRELYKTVDENLDKERRKSKVPCNNIAKFDPQEKESEPSGSYYGENIQPHYTPYNPADKNLDEENRRAKDSHYEIAKFDPYSDESESSISYYAESIQPPYTLYNRTDKNLDEENRRAIVLRDEIDKFNISRFREPNNITDHEDLNKAKRKDLTEKGRKVPYEDFDLQKNHSKSSFACFRKSYIIADKYIDEENTKSEDPCPKFVFEPSAPRSGESWEPYCTPYIRIRTDADFDSERRLHKVPRDKIAKLYPEGDEFEPSGVGRSPYYTPSILADKDLDEVYRRDESKLYLQDCKSEVLIPCSGESNETFYISHIPVDVSKIKTNSSYDKIENTYVQDNEFQPTTSSLKRIKPYFTHHIPADEYRRDADVSLSKNIKFHSQSICSLTRILTDADFAEERKIAPCNKIAEFYIQDYDFEPPLSRSRSIQSYYLPYIPTIKERRIAESNCVENYKYNLQDNEFEPFSFRSGERFQQYDTLYTRIFTDAYISEKRRRAPVPRSIYYIPAKEFVENVIAEAEFIYNQIMKFHPGVNISESPAYFSSETFQPHSIYYIPTKEFVENVITEAEIIYNQIMKFYPEVNIPESSAYRFREIIHPYVKSSIPADVEEIKTHKNANENLNNKIRKPEISFEENVTYLSEDDKSDSSTSRCREIIQPYHILSDEDQRFVNEKDDDIINCFCGEGNLCICKNEHNPSLDSRFHSQSDETESSTSLKENLSSYFTPTTTSSRAYYIPLVPELHAVTSSYIDVVKVPFGRNIQKDICPEAGKCDSSVAGQMKKVEESHQGFIIGKYGEIIKCTCTRKGPEDDPCVCWKNQQPSSDDTTRQNQIYYTENLTNEMETVLFSNINLTDYEKLKNYQERRFAEPDSSSLPSNRSFKRRNYNIRTENFTQNEPNNASTKGEDNTDRGQKRLFRIRSKSCNSKVETYKVSSKITITSSGGANIEELTYSIPSNPLLRIRIMKSQQPVNEDPVYSTSRPAASERSGSSPESHPTTTQNGREFNSSHIFDIVAKYHKALEDNTGKICPTECLETKQQRKAKKYVSDEPSTSGRLDYVNFYPCRNHQPNKRQVSQPCSKPTNHFTASSPSNRSSNTVCPPKKHYCIPIPPDYNYVMKVYSPLDVPSCNSSVKSISAKDKTNNKQCCQLHVCRRLHPQACYDPNDLPSSSRAPDPQNYCFCKECRGQNCQFK